MGRNASKTPKIKNQSILNKVSQKKGRAKPTLQIIDNRPVVDRQRKLQQAAIKSLDAKPLQLFPKPVNNKRGSRKAVNPNLNKRGKDKGVIQRKVNNIVDFDDDEYGFRFNLQERAKIEELVTAYNLILFPDQNYGQQLLELRHILGMANHYFDDVWQKYGDEFPVKRQEIVQKKQQFIGLVQQEINAVEQQTQTHATAINAKLPLLQVGVRSFFSEKVKTYSPGKINSLIAKINATNNSGKRLPLIIDLSEKIRGWKSVHLNNNSLFPKYNKPQYKYNLKVILAIEHQLDFTAPAVFHHVFQNESGGDAPSTLKSGAGLIKDGTGKIATGLRGNRMETGGKQSGAANLVSSDKVSGKLTAAGTGVNLGGDLIGIAQVIHQWTQVRNSKSARNALMETLGVASTTAADATMASSYVATMLNKNSSSSKLSKSVDYTKGIAEGIFALRNAASGIFSMYKAIRRTGIDNHLAFSYALQGGVSFGKAIVGGLRLAKTVLGMLNKIPSVFKTVLPIVAAVVDLIEAIEALHRVYVANKYKGKMNNRLTAFHNSPKGISIAGFLNPNNPMTRLESRGVIKNAKYRRFHPLAMSKISSHLAGNNAANNLTINLDAHNTTNLNHNQMKAIREYEYLSKMKEINSKRAKKGALEATGSIINLIGDALVLIPHGGIAIGIALNATTSAGSLGHSTAKFGQKLSRNKDRKHLESVAPNNNVDNFPSIAAYNSNFRNSYFANWEKVDKSSKQKNIEYYRHATFLLDRLSDIDLKDNNSVAEFKSMLKESGVDYYQFKNSKKVENTVTLLMNAMRSGR